MGFFKEIEAPTHLKAGVFGFAGSGKTYTAALIAIGLHKYIKSEKPILFVDSETGSSYVKKLFDDNGVPVLGMKTRAFVSLMGGMNEAVEGGHILLIDSITHFWQELMKSYMKKNNISKLNINHIGRLKEEWNPFPQTFLNSPIHIIMCGRAGYSWGEEEDDEGDKKLVQKGTKMKVEGDLGYEPTLLIEMEQVKESANIIGSSYTNRAWILKDKFDVIKGKHFDMPTFESFMPHIERLNIGGNPPTIDTTTTSVQTIASTSGISSRLRERDILCEELWAEMPLRFNSRTDDGKKKGADFLREAFGTLSKMGVENMSNEKIREGLNKLKELPLLTTEKEK